MTDLQHRTESHTQRYPSVAPEDIDPGHGNSPAAWTAVVIMLLAFAAGTVFFVLEKPLYVWISAGVFALGPIIGFVMAKMGLGNKPHQTDNE